MPLIPVTSIEDSRLAHYRELSSRNLTRQSGLFIAEGEKVVERLIASGFEIASLLAEPSFAERYQSRVTADTPIYVVSRDVLENTIGFNFHRGILACGHRKPPTSVGDFLTKLSRPKATIIACPDVRDPTNLGSIIRSTAAFGCDAILLGRQCADPFSRRVLRVSMGSALHIPIIESRDIMADAKTVAAADFELVAAVLDSTAEPLNVAKRKNRMVLLLGGEGHGLSAEWLELAQRKVTIPMQLGIDSLNVAVAAAVLLYHFCR
ncbi:MAG TPA: RNA methyltransferase [Pirellulaceae bacterium]|jgi:tRNA G18 (ribose-2'-O)-methylase SpoU